jgi:hypothetical protein
LYHSYNPDCEKRQGKKRVVTLEGVCGCGYIKQELIFDYKPGEKPWGPTTHIQECPACNEEYWFDWTEINKTFKPIWKCIYKISGGEEEQVRLVKRDPANLLVSWIPSEKIYCG